MLYQIYNHLALGAMAIVLGDYKSLVGCYNIYIHVCTYNYVYISIIDPLIDNNLHTHAYTNCMYIHGKIDSFQLPCIVSCLLLLKSCVEKINSIYIYIYIYIYIVTWGNYERIFQSVCFLKLK